MREANKFNARFVAILGEDELKNNVITLKDMNSGEQKQIEEEEIINILKC